MKKLLFVLLGVAFGIIMYKAEAASWFRIFEMFSFQSFHMYGFIGSALIVGVIGVQYMKRNSKDVDGKIIKIEDKSKSISRYLIGGIFFGLGWALVGACPGPIFALLGSGVLSIIIVIVGALFGTYIYGVLRKYLPH